MDEEIKMLTKTKTDAQFVKSVKKDLELIDELEKAHRLLQKHFEYAGLGGNDQWCGTKDELNFWGEMRRLGAAWIKKGNVHTPGKCSYGSEAILFVECAFPNTFAYRTKHKMTWEFGGWCDSEFVDDESE